MTLNNVPNTTGFEVWLASPRGFCRGVEMAVDVVSRALELCGTPLYVKHAIVHNNAVIRDFEAQGVVFVDRVEDIPRGAYAVFSAHGSPPQDFEQARRRKIDVIDATCRLVGNVHNWARRFAQQGYSVVVIGHHGHPESRGILGHIPPAQGHLIESVAEAQTLQPAHPDKVACVTQTTLSVDDTRHIRDLLRRRFPELKEPPNANSTICYATDNRQAAVKELAQKCDVVFVIGSEQSSNTNRLCEVARKHDASAYRIDHAKEIDPRWLRGVRAVGVTSGASAPDFLVQEVLTFLRQHGALSVAPLDVVSEDIAVFSLPPRLHEIAKEHGKALENGRVQRQLGAKT